MRSTLALAVLCLCAASPLLAENFLILPFFNLSGDSNLQWIGESLSENVRETLAAEGVLALDRDDRQEAYRRLSIRPDTQLTRATVMRVGEFVDADQIIFGTFQYTPPGNGLPRTRGTLKIVAQIINLKKASRGPEYTEIGSLEDLARLQTHLAWQTLQFVTPATAPSEQEFRSRRPVIRVEAIENYIRGLLTTASEPRLHLLQQAVRLDPKFSQANFQLGKVYWGRKAWKSAADQFVRVAPWDVRYREANFFLGLCHYKLGDFQEAQTAFGVVAQSVPLNEVWNNFGAAQSRLNSPDALASFQKALVGDPADPDYQFNVGYALFKQGNVEKAAERFRAVLDRDPNDAEATVLLGRCLKQAGKDPGVTNSQGLERLKETYEESAWLQLKAVLERKR
jgi:tetratricopeptide (TPR) repeat protein